MRFKKAMSVLSIAGIAVLGAACESETTVEDPAVEEGVDTGTEGETDLGTDTETETDLGTDTETETEMGTGTETEGTDS